MITIVESTVPISDSLLKIQSIGLEVTPDKGLKVIPDKGLKVMAGMD